jgi:ATP-dependent DNA helicase
MSLVSDVPPGLPEPPFHSAASEPTSTPDPDDPDSVPEDADEEECLLRDLEHAQAEQTHQERLHPHDQPREITAAPQLLRAALVAGQVQASDSEEDSVKQPVSSESDAAVAAEAPVKEPHYHARENQLDFLLSKASEYSQFIANDLDELQAAMAEDAQRALQKAHQKTKKRKTDTNGGTAKKTKTATDALETAQDQDTRLRQGSKPIFVQPKNLADGCILKDYQLEGVRWLASLYENGVSGILADEMGLGKTIQCVALIAHLLLQGVSGPFLVVAPLATLPNWVREFEKWLPQHPVVRYHGTAPEREAMLKGPLNPKLRRSPNFPFIVTSYEVSIRDQAKLEKLTEFTYLIVDEGHRLKNHRCTLLTSLKRLKAANRLLLTGTPIQNTLDELWSLLNFVNPQIFDDLSVFQSWFGFKDIGQKTRGGTDETSIIIEERKNQTVTKLHEILRPFLLRRIKLDVLSEMPPKKEVIVYSGISKLQAGYADLIDKGTLRDTLIAQGIENGRTLSQTNKLMNHRKNINHPFLFGEPIDPASGVHLGTAHPQLLVRASGKFALLDRMLSRLYRDGHQVLIFSQMTSVLNVMEDYLLFRNWNFCRIDGSTNIDERQRQMDQFNAEKTAGENGRRSKADDRHFVFLLSTRAGGLGINLTSADTVIIFDSDWNPHADSQAMDRAHRLGQDLPVAVYRLLTVNSVDIEMMEKQISKKKLERMTIAGGDFRKGGRRSRGDINFDHLTSLLESDIKDLNAKGGDVEDIKIDDDEFEMIMDRKCLFSSGPGAPPSEGRMYDLIEVQSGDMLGSMKT